MVAEGNECVREEVPRGAGVKVVGAAATAVGVDMVGTGAVVTEVAAGTMATAVGGTMATAVGGTMVIGVGQGAGVVLSCAITHMVTHSSLPSSHLSVTADRRLSPACVGEQSLTS